MRVDVPRAACLAWMTSYRTPLFFAQAVGRVVRARRPGESATVFLPAVRPLLALAATRPLGTASGLAEGRLLAAVLAANVVLLALRLFAALDAWRWRAASASAPALAAAAAIAVLASLVSVYLAARPVLREPIAALLRRVPPAATRGLGVLDVVVVVTIVLFGRRSKAAAALLVPYLAWILYATALNTAIIVLN